MLMLARKITVTACILISVFAVGNASGIYFYPKIYGETDSDHDEQHAEPGHDDHDEAEEDHDHEEVVALSEPAYENLELNVSKVELTSFWKSRSVPGEIVEIPGKSDLVISAPVTGVVEQVFAHAGESVSTNSVLLTMRITDEGLMSAQSKLLANVAKQTNLKKEINRIAPLSESLSGRRKRELEYELIQLESEQKTLLQELRARGLPEQHINRVLDEKQLATKLEVRFLTDTESSTESKQQLSDNNSSGYSVGDISIYPGKTVQRGGDLCRLDFHGKLFVQGRAFHSDLSVVTKIVQNDWTVQVGFGHEDLHDETENQLLKILYIDNHVDHESQAFHFYLPLKNSVTQTTKDADGRIYHQWKYKPGQHVYLKLPEEKWSDQIAIPIGAIVVDGPESYVYAQHFHEPSDDGHAHDHGDVYAEFEPVSIRLLHRDDEMAVVANDGHLRIGRRIAKNNAYKLHLALKMQQSGGGGHHHHHDH